MHSLLCAILFIYKSIFFSVTILYNGIISISYHKSIGGTTKIWWNTHHVCISKCDAYYKKTQIIETSDFVRFLDLEECTLFQKT